MPLGESMISTLKSNNKIKLDKSKRFRKTLGGYNKKKKVEYNLPTATPEQLENIRARIKKDNRLLWLKVVIVSKLVITALVWMLFAS